MYCRGVCIKQFLVREGQNYHFGITSGLANLILYLAALGICGCSSILIDFNFLKVHLLGCGLFVFSEGFNVEPFMVGLYFGKKPHDLVEFTGFCERPAALFSISVKVDCLMKLMLTCLFLLPLQEPSLRMLKCNLVTLGMTYIHKKAQMSMYDDFSPNRCHFRLMKVLLGR